VQLIATPDNPIPADATVISVETQDRLSLRVAYWPATGEPPRGTVCILQGRAEFIEKYFETIEELRGRGFAVVAFDWRGQGLSRRQIRDPRKGHVRDLGHFRRDLDAIRKSVLEPLMPKPHFGLAHSMGAAIALMAAKEGWLPFTRLVALTPMLALCRLRGPRFKAGLAFALNLFGLGQSYIPGGRPRSIATQPFPGNRLTGDPGRYARNAAIAAALGPGAIGDPTIGWAHAAFRFMQRLAEPRVPLAIRVPTLVIAAGADSICLTPVIERFAARLKAGHAIVIPNARHEILMERDRIREEFWAAFDAFIPGTPDPAFGSSASVEKLKGGGVQPRMPGRDDGAALRGRAAVPGGHDAARALDDRDQRDDVVGLEAGLDHEVDVASR
jgi:lysophospholipase